uniref:LIM zinc-binding domain-containing protein n=1 Tax=Chromera velia CCMP2878 TaxID=1169474 RepID=A0A0G4HEC0_9ALVE|eukprot:Cvel_6474.t1-p1 / transcript=Cvel_6474.t1 / gene=Cvel_6474 / organism=Chromera_velia_CCMP2878 / gene_product=hypothetical protein / transcript_product=hypothetical protein / location=Cvel_scaffold317:88651-90869(-) / protein_length=474 / sequence_SO=supercontig / SO=protein_coding / is_pseudo=false
MPGYQTAPGLEGTWAAGPADQLHSVDLAVVHDHCMVCHCGGKISAQEGPRVRNRALLHRECARDVCAHCGKGLMHGEKVWSVGTQKFHTDCLHCRECRGPIGREDTAIARDGEPFHAACVQCAYCEKPLGSDYSFHPQWRSHYMCKGCADTLHRCLSCEGKVVPWKDKNAGTHIGLKSMPVQRDPLYHSDGKVTCGECALLDCVCDSESASLILQQTLQMLEQDFGMPFSTVRNRPHPSASKSGEETGFGGPGQPLFLVKPATHEELNTKGEGTDDGSSVRGPHGGEEPDGYSTYGKCVQKEYKDGHKCVPRIQVMAGMPRVIFAAHLAHELTHAFLWLRDFPQMPSELEEGICNSLEFMVLQRELSGIERLLALHSSGMYSSNTTTGGMGGSLKWAPARGSALVAGPRFFAQGDASMEGFLRALQGVIRFRLEKMEACEHEAYGKGFRRVLKSVKEKGLMRVLDHICRFCELP